MAISGIVSGQVPTLVPRSRMLQLHGLGFQNKIFFSFPGFHSSPFADKRDSSDLIVSVSKSYAVTNGANEVVMLPFTRVKTALD